MPALLHTLPLIDIADLTRRAYRDERENSDFLFTILLDVLMSRLSQAEFEAFAGSL